MRFGKPLNPLLLVLALTGLAACNNSSAPAVASVQVTPASASVAVGQTVTLTAAALDASGKPVSGATFTWASDNNAVATVDAAGGVKGVAKGTANITARSAGKTSAAVAVTVTDPAPTNTISGTLTAPAGGSPAGAIVVACPIQADGICHAGDNTYPLKDVAFKGVGADGKYTITIPANQLTAEYEINALKDVNGNGINYEKGIDYNGKYPTYDKPARVKVGQTGVDFPLIVQP